MCASVYTLHFEPDKILTYDDFVACSKIPDDVGYNVNSYKNSQFDLYVC